MTLPVSVTIRILSRTKAAETINFYQSSQPPLIGRLGETNGDFMKKITLLPILFLFSISLCGCGDRHNIPIDTYAVGEYISNEEVEIPLVLNIDETCPGFVLEPSPNDIKNWERFGGSSEHDTILDHFSVTETGVVMEIRNIKYGELHLQFSNVRVIDCASDMPEKKLALDKYRIPPDLFFCYDGIERTIGLNSPDFLQSGDKFYPGVYMILIDVAVFSDGAVNWTTSDIWNVGGYHTPAGSYSDPYLFRADVVSLCDLSRIDETVPVTTYEPIMVCYYSKMGMCEEDPMAFSISPGETITFTLGFLAGDKQQGGQNDFASLMLSSAGRGTIDSTYIDLKLKEPVY